MIVSGMPRTNVMRIGAANRRWPRERKCGKHTLYADPEQEEAADEREQPGKEEQRRAT